MQVDKVTELKRSVLVKFNVPTLEFDGKLSDTLCYSELVVLKRKTDEMRLGTAYEIHDMAEEPFLKANENVYNFIKLRFVKFL
jgi:hypothetical protein